MSAYYGTRGDMIERSEFTEMNATVFVPPSSINELLVSHHNGHCTSYTITFGFRIAFLPSSLHHTAVYATSATDVIGRRTRHNTLSLRRHLQTIYA